VLRRGRGRVGMGSDRLARLTRTFTALARPPHRPSAGRSRDNETPTRRIPAIHGRANRTRLPDRRLHRLEDRSRSPASIPALAARTVVDRVPLRRGTQSLQDHKQPGRDHRATRDSSQSGRRVNSVHVPHRLEPPQFTRPSLRYRARRTPTAGSYGVSSTIDDDVITRVAERPDIAVGVVRLVVRTGVQQGRQSTLSPLPANQSRW
jgi:hypothetical protein